jgi:hypothetical protein
LSTAISPVRTLPGLGTPDIHGRLGVGILFTLFLICLLPVNVWGIITLMKRLPTLVLLMSTVNLSALSAYILAFATYKTRREFVGKFDDGRKRESKPVRAFSQGKSEGLLLAPLP